jgi:hypothetical protein
MKCEREPGGAKAAEFGVCPSSIKNLFDGINEGKNGGRSCWAITGTYCGEKVQGTFASKIDDCKQCDFYRLVKREQGNNFQDTDEIRQRRILDVLEYQTTNICKAHLLIK